MSENTSASRTAAARARLPFFYGWVLVGVAFVTMAVGVNARTAFSLLYPPILDEFGWDRGLTAGVFSFGFLLSALITPFVGRLIDRRGPRAVAALHNAWRAMRRRGQLLHLCDAFDLPAALVRAPARAGDQHRLLGRRV